MVRGSIATGKNKVADLGMGLSLLSRTDMNDVELFETEKTDQSLEKVE